MSENPAPLAATLESAESGQREALVIGAALVDLLSAVGVLGQRRTPHAANALQAVEAFASDKAVRKAARKELHRLQSVGIKPSEAAPAPAPAAPSLRQERLAPAEAWASSFDTVGARSLWVLADDPRGGIQQAGFTLSSVDGLMEVGLSESSRSRFRRQVEEWQSQMGTAWVQLPADYGMRLVREALDAARARGHGFPPSYAAFVLLFGEAPGPPERPLVYETISPLEARLHPEWLATSSALFREPEVAPWRIFVPAELRAQALDVVRSASSSLLIPGASPEERALGLVADASALLLPPEARHSLRRRLEETAYTFVKTGRDLAARQAVAAADALTDSARPAYQQPFQVLLLASSLSAALRGTGGGAEAADILVEVLRLAFQAAARDEVEPGPTTTASGLILPS